MCRGAFCSPKGMSLNPSFLPILFFFGGGVLLSSLSKFHFFLCFFVHQPLFGKHYYLGFLLYFFWLPFPFLMFAYCFFETNLPDIPFLNPSRFHFGFVLFLVLFLFLFSWCMFCLSVSMLVLFSVSLCLCFCFCLVSCFAFSL